MKSGNMDKLVKQVGNYVESGKFQFSPFNTQYLAMYLDIFLDENTGGARAHIDSFSESLTENLINKRKLIGLDANTSASKNNEQLQRYEKFLLAWEAWNNLYDTLIKKNKIL